MGLKIYIIARGIRLFIDLFIRFRPELALTHLQLAELLLEHYPDEKKEALEHLDFAIKEFREIEDAAFAGARPEA